MSSESETKPLDLIFRPRSVAIIGLSRGAVGSPVSILTSLEDFGYDGDVYVVNPKMPAVSGITVCKTIEDLPEGLDLAVISVERSTVVDIVERCAGRGIRAAIVITQGFADADEAGAEEQRRLTEVIERSGIRVLGPNTIGVADARAGFTSSFIEISRDPASPVGQVAQSGFLMMGHHLVNNEAAGFGKTVDLGNACDLGLVDVLEYYEADDDIGVIECHLEAIEDGRGFLEAAARIARRKPIVALKAGKSRLGLKAVASHTGAVAGESRVYHQALRQAGVVEARSAEELRLFSKAFATYGKAAGRRVAVVSFSGGGAVLALDAIDDAGLELAELSAETLDSMRHFFPAWLEIENPLDIWIPIAKDMESSFPAILEGVLNDDAVDAVLCIYCSYNLPKYQNFDVSQHVSRLAASYPDKPIACWSYGQDIEGITKTVEASGKAMVFPSLDGAAQALAHLADHHQRTQQAARPQTARSGAAPQEVAGILQRAQGKAYLFTEAFEILEAYDLPVAPWALVEAADSLETATNDLKAPFCLKASSQDIVHKSESGGVVLGVERGAALEEAYDGLCQAVRRNAPGAKLEGVVVQEMAAKGIEVMVGMVRDPSFGPCIVVGSGGIYAEVLDDVALRVAPVDAEEARAMIRETKISRILSGVRGEAAADSEALVKILVALSRFALDHDAVQEIDLNPVIVGKEGAAIVDARFIMSDLAAGACGQGLVRADVG
ncbi:MAG: acetate--CoA ligase family protein [Rhodovibrionaceae bacterium]